MPDVKLPTLSEVITPIEGEAAPAAETTEPTIPDAYQGKSLEEVIAIAEQNATNHREVQQALGRQGNELGEVRRLTDQLIQADLGNRTTGQVASSEPTSLDLDSFDDPKAATDAISALVDRKVAEKLGAVENKVANLTGASVEQRLNNDHPEWRSTIMSQEYTDWVKASSVRRRLAAEGNAGEYESGHELLSTWEALNPKKPEAVADEVAAEGAKEDKLKDATLETGPSKRRQTKKPVYRRADILELRMKDPDRYDTMRAEIRQAFADGRVK